MRNSAARASGFTLMELLVAITIFGVLATMVYSALNAVISKNDAIKDGVEVYGMAKNCMSRIARDLTGVYVIRYPEYEPPGLDDDPDPYRFEAEEDFVRSGNFPRVRFVSTAHLPMGPEPVAAGLAEIRYYVVKSDDSEDTVILKRADTPFPYDTEFGWDPDHADDPILCEGIESLTFTCFDEEGNPYTIWDSDDPSIKHETPRAVAVDMTIRTKGGSHRFSTRVDIPVYRERLENVAQ